MLISVDSSAISLQFSREELQDVRSEAEKKKREWNKEILERALAFAEEAAQEENYRTATDATAEIISSAEAADLDDIAEIAREK